MKKKAFSTGLAAGALLLAVLAFGGCGGGDSSAAATVEVSGISKAQFVKQADAICTAGGEERLERISEYMSEHEGTGDEGELSAAALQVEVLPEVEAQIEEIRALGAPSGDRERIEAFLAAQRQSVESLESRRSVSLTTGLSRAFRRPGKLARQYGIQACAYG